MSEISEMKNMDKKLSIITPVYNRADCIIACLDSVSRQTVPDGWAVEHVVVDDGSSDNTATLVEEYAKTHPNVSLYRMDRNRGTNAARNEAIRQASGTWIELLDSDDEMLPGAVNAVCKSIEENPDVKHFLFATDDTIGNRSSLGAEKLIPYEDFLLEKIGGDFVHVLLRSTMLDMLFSEDLLIYEGLFFLHYYKVAQKMLYRAEVIYHRDRHRADHVTFKLNMTSNTTIMRKIAAYRFKIDRYRDELMKVKGGREIIARDLAELYQFCVLVGNREGASAAAKELHELGGNVSLAYKCVNALHAGPPLWFVIKQIVKLKHYLKSH